MSRTLAFGKLWNLRQKLDLVYGFDREPQVWSMIEPTRDNALSRALSEAKSVVHGWGGTLQFVYLPGWNRYRNSPRVAEREHSEVLGLVNAVGIPVIDVHPTFQAHKDPLLLFPFRRFGHFNEQGNREVAETILRFLSLP